MKKELSEKEMENEFKEEITAETKEGKIPSHLSFLFHMTDA